MNIVLTNYGHSERGITLVFIPSHLWYTIPMPRPRKSPGNVSCINEVEITFPVIIHPEPEKGLSRARGVDLPVECGHHVVPP